MDLGTVSPKFVNTSTQYFSSYYNNIFQEQHGEPNRRTRAYEALPVNIHQAKRVARVQIQNQSDRGRESLSLYERRLMHVNTAILQLEDISIKTKKWR
jgi:hypothetical protein